MTLALPLPYHQRYHERYESVDELKEVGYEQTTDYKYSTSLVCDSGAGEYW
jgi:hypothetical protein